MAATALVPVRRAIILLVLMQIPWGSWAEAARPKSASIAQQERSFAVKPANHGRSAAELHHHHQLQPQAAAAGNGRGRRRKRQRRLPRGRGRSSRSRAAQRSKYAYFGFNGRWRSHSNLTYALSPTDVTTLVPRRDIVFALESAFRTWATVVPLTFTRLDDADWEWADIKVSFLGGEHGDGQPFDGTLGVLGHSFAPEDGRMHLDIAEQWSVDVTAEHVAATMDLQSVVLHEAGHLIGLGHSADPGAAMFADIAPHQVKHSLSADDIQGAQSLYGSSQVYQVLQGANFAPSQGPSSGIGEVARGAWKQLHLIFLVAAWLVD